MYLISFSLRLLLILFSTSDSWSNNTIQDSDKYATNQVAEKVYLHIDRSNYTSGDNIWFKAYIIDPSTNRLSVNTSNLYVELIAPDSKIIQRRTVKIENGTGHGDFQLNDSIPSGRFRIRAYTNYMRNYDEQFFFLKEITVVSPYDEVQGLNKPTKKIDNKIDITFFPEG